MAIQTGLATYASTSKQAILTPVAVDLSISAYKNESSPFSNAYGKGSDNEGSYAEWGLVTGAQAYTKVYWSFDMSSIPNNATITNVTCSARCSNTNASIMQGGNTLIAIGVGETTKASSDNASFGKSPTVVTVSNATFTRAELDNFRLKIQAVRGFLSTGASYHTKFYGATLTIDYTVPSDPPSIPVITIQSQNVAKISSVVGHDQCIVAFTANQALTYWEARATTSSQVPSHGTGLLVESGTLDEGETGYIYVDDEELTNGDLNYRIDIYGQNSAGVWSDD